MSDFCLSRILRRLGEYRALFMVSGSCNIVFPLVLGDVILNGRISVFLVFLPVTDFFGLDRC